MSELGEGSREASQAASPNASREGSASPPRDLATMQQRIMENHALVLALREELRQARGSSTVGSALEAQVESSLAHNPITPEDSISLYAEASTDQPSAGHLKSSTAGGSLSVIGPGGSPLQSAPCPVERSTSAFVDNVRYVSDLLQLSKRKDGTNSFRSRSEQLLSTGVEASTSNSLPPSDSVVHWLYDTNTKIRGSEDRKVLKQQRDSLQAHHKGMVGSEMFSNSRQRIYPAASYRLHDPLVESNPQVLDADHDQLQSWT